MSLVRALDKNLEIDGIAITTVSEVIHLSEAKSFSIQCTVDVNTPTGKTFTAAVTDIITTAAHGYVTGLKGQATTTTTLPAGLALATDYYVIVLSADTFSLAASLVDALAGTAIDITDTGTGVHTFTATALAGATVTLQKSNNGVTYEAVDTATAITADAVIWFAKVDPEYKYARLSYTLTAGLMSTDNHVVVKTLV